MDRETRIRAIAYAIWEDEGCPDGQAEAHWHRACALVESEAALPGDSSPEWLQRKDRGLRPHRENGKDNEETAAAPKTRKTARRAA
ncbi:MAG: DUF2934 domain-containing protein [Alphaproteobacteria bacterium]|nr:DUF2934 domain-containing protein [Alphaproteobacteria bacterium]